MSVAGRSVRPREPGHCALWLPRKNRYCRFSCVEGFDYCGHHLASRGENTAGPGAAVRIPCPLDPRHSIFEKDLAKHLLICPKGKEAAEMAALPCYRQDVNAGDDVEPTTAGAATNATPVGGSADAT
eukprot:6182356-Prymnesium_polylepis.1